MMPDVYADDTGVALSDVYDVYQAVGQFCGGISDRISSVSGIAKVNTGIGAVGTVAAGGALYSGIKKSQTDKEIENLSEKICKIGGCDPNKVEAMSDEEFFETVFPLLVEMMDLGEEEKITEVMSLRAEQDAKIAKSKRLGNWRSGLLAGTLGTNVASAIVAGLNKNQSDLIQQVSACNESVAKLRDVYGTALAQGINPLENPVMETFSKTLNRCGALQVSDVEKIEKRMNVVMGTAIGGAVIGAVGTGTSIAANTDKVRNDNSESGKKKENTLNTVSNVAAGANVATGLVETGFNISLITLTKKLMNTAQECEDTL